MVKHFGLSRPEHDLLQNLLGGYPWDHNIDIERGRHHGFLLALKLRGYVEYGPASGPNLTVAGRALALKEGGRRQRRSIGAAVTVAFLLLLAGCQSAPPEVPSSTPEARQCQALYPPFQPLHCPLYGCAGACLDLAPARTWDALQRWLAEHCGSDPACGDAKRIADAMRPVFGK